MGAKARLFFRRFRGVSHVTGTLPPIKPVEKIRWSWAAARDQWLNKLSKRLVVGLVVGLAFGLFSGLRDGLAVGLRGRLVFGLVGGLLGGLLGGLRFGGHAYLHHFALRLVLWQKNLAPLHYVRFLDHATARLFLRKVGGGYVFIHRMLLEYFAALHPTSTEQQKCNRNG